MRTTSTLLSSVIGLVLSTAAVHLPAQQADAPPLPANREEIRRLLRELPPEERRSLIQELRDQKATQPRQPRPNAAPPSVNREEISRQLRDLPPEERRERIRELREQRAAQPDNPRPEMRRPAPGASQPGERPPFRGLQAGQAGRFAPMFERVLTEDQRVSFREAMESQRDKLRELGEELRAARREALEASVTREFDEELVRQKAMAVAQAEAEMAVLRARALSQIRPSLSADQIERLRNPPLLGGGAPPRADFQRNEPRRGDRPVPGPRDDRDSPSRPGPER
jgi:Spy/CpxP family protein refolding chaperone